ncbi:MAG: hypothetical protein AAFY20_01715 [Cyanobacteria bacterium J06639_14]
MDTVVLGCVITWNALPAIVHLAQLHTIVHSAQRHVGRQAYNVPILLIPRRLQAQLESQLQRRERYQQSTKDTANTHPSSNGCLD